MIKQKAARRVIAGIIVAAPILFVSAAQATTVNFNYSGTNGYTAIGSFTYNGATAPAVITEANGAAPTSVLQSFDVSFFNPARTLLETGSSVINGVSSDRFFRLTYNTTTNTITALDGDIGGSYVYFLSNLRTPTGSVVAAGQTTFNFFNRNTADAALDTAASITSTVVPTAVPEPASWAGLLAGVAALLGLRRVTRRRSPADALA